MSSKRKQYIIILVISIIVVVLPFILSEDYKDKMNISFGLIAGLSSLITLIIAIQLNDRFDSEKNLQQKRSEEVFKLIELVNKDFIIFSLKRKDYHLSINPFNYDIKKVEEYYGKKIRISTHYLDFIRPILSSGAQIYLPKSIAEKVKKLDVIGLTYLSDHINENEIVVTARPTNFPQDSIGKPFGPEQNLLEFINQWNNLSEEIKNWIKSNYESYNELNIN